MLVKIYEFYKNKLIILHLYMQVGLVNKGIKTNFESCRFLNKLGIESPVRIGTCTPIAIGSRPKPNSPNKYHK